MLNVTEQSNNLSIQRKEVSSSEIERVCEELNRYAMYMVANAELAISEDNPFKYENAHDEWRRVEALLNLPMFDGYDYCKFGIMTFPAWPDDGDERTLAWWNRYPETDTADVPF